MLLPGPFVIRHLLTFLTFLLSASGWQSRQLTGPELGVGGVVALHSQSIHPWKRTLPYFDIVPPALNCPWLSLLWRQTYSTGYFLTLLCRRRNEVPSPMLSNILLKNSFQLCQHLIFIHEKKKCNLRLKILWNPFVVWRFKTICVQVQRCRVRFKILRF